MSKYLTMNAAQIAKAALAEVGHDSDITNENQSLKVGWETPPDVVFKAWNVGRVSCGLDPYTLDEWVAKITSPGGVRTHAENAMWLKMHNVEVS